jgi:hypothetical protein
MVSTWLLILLLVLALAAAFLAGHSFSEYRLASRHYPGTHFPERASFRAYVVVCVVLALCAIAALLGGCAMKCGGCRFAQALTDGAKALECHRRPPVPVLLLEMSMNGPQQVVRPIFPVMGAESWCGDYAPKLATVA